MDKDNFVKALRAKKTPGTKINRSAFLYLEGGKDFAQCGTCLQFDRKRSKCAIFGPDKDVDADDSCGLYLPGEYQGQELKRLVSPKEAGFVEDKEVRCENCAYGGSGECGLFKKLNKELPDTFDLDTKIKPHGCCNGWIPK